MRSASVHAKCYCLAAVLVLVGVLGASLTAGQDRADMPKAVSQSQLSIGGASLGSNRQVMETGVGPSPYLVVVQQGADFAATGTTTRRFNPCITNVQSEPFSIIAPSLPTGADPVATYITWGYLLLGDPPSTDTITINSTQIVGDIVATGTPDLNWGKDGAATYWYEDTANIINHGQSITFSNATDKPLGDDPEAYGQGITLLTIYSIPGSYPRRIVHLYRGYASTDSSPEFGNAIVNAEFVRSYQGGDLHTFINVHDGQLDSPACGGFRDRYFVNEISRDGLSPGTGTTLDDAWQGLIGPSTDSNLYDFSDEDMSTFLSSPLNDIKIESKAFEGGLGIEDRIAHSVFISSFSLICDADLNDDGTVDGADLGLLLGAWGTDDQFSDLNDSGLVDGADLGLLLGAWGVCP